MPLPGLPLFSQLLLMNITSYGMEYPRKSTAFHLFLPANADSFMKAALVIINSIPDMLNAEDLDIWWLFIVCRENGSESNTPRCQLIYHHFYKFTAHVGKYSLASCLSTQC